MPIYEFVCSCCGERSEELVSINTKEVICKKCGGEALKVVSAPSFILKGSCWAKDNYGLKNSKEKGGN